MTSSRRLLGVIAHVNVFGADQAAELRAAPRALGRKFLLHAPTNTVCGCSLSAADSENVQRADDQVREDMIAVAHDLVGVPRETVERRFRVVGDRGVLRAALDRAPGECAASGHSSW